MEPQQQQQASSSASSDDGLVQPPPVESSASAAAPFSAQWRRASSSKRRADGADTTKQTKEPHADPLGGFLDGLVAGGKQPKLTDEEKVEKHRMIVRRSYYQKKELKVRLKQDIERLEKQYNELMARTQPSAITTSGSSHTEGEAATASSIDLFMCTCCDSIPCVRALYRELSLKKEELRTQNDALEEQILEHLNFHDKVSFIAARQLDGGDTRAAGKKSSLAPQSKQSKAAATSAGLITVETSDCWLSFLPLTEEECFATIRAVQRDVISQRSSTSFKDVGLPVMGWNRKRTYGSEAKFSLLKRFEVESAVQLSERAWSAYTESDLFAQLYSGAVNMRFQLLQRVNSNNVLFYRSLKTDLLKMRRTTFFQLSRVQIDHQFFLIFCSIEPTRIQPDITNRYNWLDMFSWLCFSDYEDEHGSKYCEVEFGGNVPSASVADNEFWMMEFLSYLLRFENKFVRPVFNVTLGELENFEDGADHSVLPLEADEQRLEHPELGHLDRRVHHKAAELHRAVLMVLAYFAEDRPDEHIGPDRVAARDLSTLRSSTTWLELQWNRETSGSDLLTFVLFEICTVRYKTTFSSSTHCTKSTCMLMLDEYNSRNSFTDDTISHVLKKTH